MVSFSLVHQKILAHRPGEPGSAAAIGDFHGISAVRSRIFFVDAWFIGPRHGALRCLMPSKWLIFGFSQKKSPILTRKSGPMSIPASVT